MAMLSKLIGRQMALMGGLAACAATARLCLLAARARLELRFPEGALTVLDTN